MTHGTKLIVCFAVFSLSSFFASSFRQALFRRQSLHRLHGTSKISESVPVSSRDEIVQRVVPSALKTFSVLGSIGLFLAKSSPSLAEVVAPSDLKPVVVLGSAGKTGKLIVNSLVSKGYKVRPTFREVVTRDIDTSNALLENSVQADVKNVESLINAITGASTVIFAASASKKGGDAKSVDFEGVQNIAKACIQQKIPKLIVISSGAVTRPNSIGFKMTNLFGRIMEYKLLGENALRDLYRDADPNLSYVIVRPGGLKDGKADGPAKITINQGDTHIGDVSRADVAECVVAAAISATIPKDVTLEIYLTDGSGALEGNLSEKSGYERAGAEFDSFDKMLDGLTPDSALKRI